PMPAPSFKLCYTPQDVILSVAAGREPRLLHSLAATEGSEAAAAPQLAVGRVIRGSPCAPAAWVRAPTQDPSAAARRSCESGSARRRRSGMTFFRPGCRLG